MARLLLLVALVAVLLWAARRAIAGPRGRRKGGGVLGAPERLVCGGCGHEFDPDPTGWICPRCGR